MLHATWDPGSTAWKMTLARNCETSTTSFAVLFLMLYNAKGLAFPDDQGKMLSNNVRTVVLAQQVRVYVVLKED